MEKYKVIVNDRGLTKCNHLGYPSVRCFFRDFDGLGMRKQRKITKLKDGVFFCLV